MSSTSGVSRRPAVILGALAAALLSAGPAVAQRPGCSPMGHCGMANEPAPAANPPNSGSLMQAMAKMDKDMAGAPMTGDLDHDFVAMMLPQRQGAADMAQVELAGGKDPVLRKLAEDIIAAEQREIALMRNWLAQHPTSQ